MIHVVPVTRYMNGGCVKQAVMSYCRHVDRSSVRFDFLVCEGPGMVEPLRVIFATFSTMFRRNMSER